MRGYFIHLSIQGAALWAALSFGAWIMNGCASSGGSESLKRRAQAIQSMLETEVGDVDDDMVELVTQKPPKAHKKSIHQVRAERELHRKIWWWLNYYSVRDRDRFVRNLERGERYRPLVQQILRQHHLPQELYYLALIESGYVTGANSTANAIGIWQFMKPTAAQYGLGMHGTYDERKHPIAATHAAARYLSDLHDQFDSWYLAIAAYNAGQGRIRAAVKRGKTNDFWKLVERKLLPQETIDYIPKFLAAATIGQNLDTFGFKIKRSVNQWPELTRVMIASKNAQSVKRLTKLTGLSAVDLNRFNPQLAQSIARPGLKKLVLWVPLEVAQRLQKVPSVVVAQMSTSSARKL